MFFVFFLSTRVPFFFFLVRTFQVVFEIMLYTCTNGTIGTMVLIMLSQRTKKFGTYVRTMVRTRVQIQHYLKNNLKYDKHSVRTYRHGRHT
jgi:hypothetical protein